MKRKGNLYPAIYDFDNIVSSYNEVCRKDMGTSRGLALANLFYQKCKIECIVYFHSLYLTSHIKY